MKCQNCHHNEADFHIRFASGDNEWAVHLCGDCAAGIQQFTQAALNAYQKHLVSAGQGGSIPPVFEQSAAPRQDVEPGMSPASISLAPTVVQDIRLRRRINELQALLQEAIGAEEYEKAAKLRDEMKQLEKGACTS